MTVVTTTKSGFSVKAYRGDRKTLLAFNLPENDSARLAGFYIQCAPPTGTPYYINNMLRFADTEGHSQLASPIVLTVVARDTETKN